MTGNQIDAEDHLVHSKTQHFENGIMPGLTQVPTSVTLSAEQFERLYLNPMMHRQSALTKNLGNPTPLYIFTSSFKLEGLALIYQITEDWEHLC
jgi:hypothetical protein